MLGGGALAAPSSAACQSDPGHEQVHELKLPGDLSVVVCAREKLDSPHPGKVRVQDFRVRAKTVQGKWGELLFSGFPHETYDVSSKLDRLVIERIENLNEDWRPLVLHQISCQGDLVSCRVSAPRCAYHRKRLKDKSTVKVIRSHLKQAKKPVTVDSRLLEKASELALDGQPAARDLFKAKPRKLLLEGEQEKLFSDTGVLLKQMEKAGCFR